MPTTPNMGLVLPTEDGSSGTWDTLLNAVGYEIDAHDHSPGNGVLVPSDGIGIDADLAFAGFAATGLKAVDFNAIAAASMSGYAGALFMSSADNELYWRTSGGVNVQVTSGSSLNAALLGGFTGDYGSGDEEAEFTSGSGIYNFLVNSNTRGFIDCSDIRLFEATGGVTNAVKLRSPAALAASYTMTMPAALPGSTSLVVLSAAGALSTSLAPALTSLSTTAEATIGTSATIGTTLGVTGAATLSSTLGVAGLISAAVGLQAAAGANIEVIGDGRFIHGNWTDKFPASAGYAAGGSATLPTTGDVDIANASVHWMIPIRGYESTKQIVSISLRLTDSSDNTDLDLVVVSDSGAALASAGAGWIASSAASGAAQTITMTGSVPERIGSQALMIRVRPPDANIITLHWVEITFMDEGN